LLTLELPGTPHAPSLALSARVIHAAGEGDSWVAGCALVECQLSEAALQALPRERSVR
jgi:hypothetical protein